LVIKIDSYYNSLNQKITPPSVDCLIVVKCADGTFSIILVELKNIKKLKRVKKPNLRDKFKTTIKQFMEKRFKRIFMDEKHTIKSINLYFVARPFRNTDRASSLEREYALLGSFKFRKMTCEIVPKAPHPVIENC
ncbi:MAG: hypothetical protein GY765_20900, partial [bacterium]|nr:hypothetical protein [bacterium]